jgi:hypothetical protein
MTGIAFLFATAMSLWDGPIVSNAVELSAAHRTDREVVSAE